MQNCAARVLLIFNAARTADASTFAFHINCCIVAVTFTVHVPNKQPAMAYYIQMVAVEHFNSDWKWVPSTWDVVGAQCTHRLGLCWRTFLSHKSVGCAVGLVAFLCFSSRTTGAANLHNSNESETIHGAVAIDAVSDDNRSPSQWKLNVQIMALIIIGDFARKRVDAVRSIFYFFSSSVPFELLLVWMNSGKWRRRKTREKTKVKENTAKAMKWTKW